MTFIRALVALTRPAIFEPNYRRSYYKMIAAALLVTVAAAPLALVAAYISNSLLAALLWATAIIVALAGALVVMGGVIGLHRDSLEAAGTPYVPLQPRERTPGMFTSLRRRALQLLASNSARLRLRPGEWVRVRSYAQIAATLDVQGRLDGLPFMPEMLRFCGQRLRVHRRLDKINDYVHATGLRRMRDAVLLERVRCPGDRHGGCQAACQMIWKESWLSADGDARAAGEPALSANWVEWLDQQTQQAVPAGGTRFVCQMTEVGGATTPMSWADPRHFLRDLWCGNVRFGPWLVGVSINLFNGLQRLRQGVTVPYLPPNDRKNSPLEVLDLQPGERVRVKTTREIESTLNRGSRNRGLWWDIEMHRYCGGEYRVEKRIDRMIEEKSGKLLTMSNPCIVLEDAFASGEYLAFCPQNELIYWREIWLTRASASDVLPPARS